MTSPTSDKTERELELPALIEALVARCNTEAGRARARGMRPDLTRDDIAQLIELGREAHESLVAGEPLPTAGARDTDAAMARLRTGAVLPAADLRDIASSLGAARRLHDHVEARRHRFGRLAVVLSIDEEVIGVEDRLVDAFTPDGTIADHASPGLRALRDELRAHRSRIEQKLEELIERYRAVLADAFFTERGGRYVLPLRADAHERFAGLVHASSNSGQTLFIEPRAIIAQGNRLKMIEAEVAREEEAVLAKLTALVREREAAVRAALSALAEADRLGAIGRLAVDARLTFVLPDDEPALELRAARHPLLTLTLGEVVASDLRATPGRAIVISGPNAGGKTVALKTLGLTALMLRAGLPVPCARGSRVGLFSPVLADIGDRQSISANLSTFSAHARALAEIVAASSPTALVLLDEIATGTDPREGEALAAAVLDALCAAGAATVCTTHYEGLKLLAAGDDRFENASVGWRTETLTPTFEVLLGIPGASSALSVAERFGIPSRVIERARRFLTRDERDFQKLVEALHAERQALSLAREQAERARGEAEARTDELSREIDRMRERGRVLLTSEAEALLEAVRKAREDLRVAQAKLRLTKQLDAPTVDAARATIDAVAAKASVGGDVSRVVGEAEAGPSLTSARKGDRVFVPRLRVEAEVIDVLPNNQLRVAAGPMKLTLSLADVRAPRDVRDEGSRDQQRPAQTRQNTCDLRGYRTDEAVRMARAFVARSSNEGREVAYLVHGQGKGPLGDALRLSLGEDPRVARLSSGGRDEGAVTVVWLR